MRSINDWIYSSSSLYMSVVTNLLLSLCLSGKYSFVFNTIYSKQLLRHQTSAPVLCFWFYCMCLCIVGHFCAQCGVGQCTPQERSCY